jgi:two-component system sensor histidine kinase YcbA
MIFFFVAIIRVVIGLAIVVFLKQYTQLIRRDEHEIRYKQLLMLTSNLKSEAYFMQKNMDYIEYVMSDAYTLYSDLDELEEDDVKKIALKIATDIHEIKKNYSRVVDGLGKLVDGEVRYSAMKITELVKVLKFSITRYLQMEQSDIKFQTNVHTSRSITDHYLLMSVLRNIVNNAIEELEKSNPSGSIKLRYTEKEGYSIFSIQDNGSGIDEEDLKYIFEAGFSTKFDDETGNMCRGVGLALVKDIVENKLNGKLEVHSTKGVGTLFDVYIKREYMGG